MLKLLRPIASAPALAAVLAAVLTVCSPGTAAAFSAGANAPQTESGTDPLILSDDQLYELGAFSQQACKICMGNSWTQDTVRADEMTDEQQAFLLYWYQYNITDSRIIRSDSGEWNTASRADLLMILEEMFGESLNADTLEVFLTSFADHEENDLVYMSGVGDFGDAGPYYFDPPSEYYMEGDLIVVSGAVMGWNSNMQCYIHQDMYTGYFSDNPSDSGDKTAFCLDHVTLGF